jgi:DNA-binding CsgD family transcriptional regulator
MDKWKRDKKIAEALVKYGYLQVEIARYLGMHYSTISNLLKGKR